MKNFASIHCCMNTNFCLLKFQNFKFHDHTVRTVGVLKYLLYMYYHDDNTWFKWILREIQLATKGLKRWLNQIILILGKRISCLIPRGFQILWAMLWIFLEKSVLTWQMKLRIQFILLEQWSLMLPLISQIWIKLIF